MDKAEAFYLCTPLLNTIYHKVDYIWSTTFNEVFDSREPSFHDHRCGTPKALNDLAAALRKMPELETDIFSRLASLVEEAQASKFADLESWFDKFSDAERDFRRFIFETAGQLYGAWGAAFLMDYVVERTLKEAVHFSKQWDGESITKWYSQRRRPKVTHIIWFARYVDGKLSYQQVRDRHQELTGEDVSRDAIVKAIKRMRRWLGAG